MNEGMEQDLSANVMCAMCVPSCNELWCLCCRAAAHFATYVEDDGNEGGEVEDVGCSLQARACTLLP